MTKTSLIFFTLSFTLNLFLLGLVLVLWFIRCPKCQKDKEFRKVFNKLCEKCSNGKEKKGNNKKEVPTF